MSISTQLTDIDRSRCTGCTETCSDAECLACGERDCPHGEPLHYHHDGCPACEEFDTPTIVRLQLLLRKLATGHGASTRLAARMQLADAKALDDGPEMFADLCARVREAAP